MEKINISNQQQKKMSYGHYEKSVWKGKELICGIDEVGRGCLAGPVVTAAVILPVNTNRKGLCDSKVLSESQRIEQDQWIRSRALYAYGIIHPRVIDKHNIYQSTLLGMKRALLQLLSRSLMLPKLIVVDAMPLSLRGTAYEGIPVKHFPFGESVSPSIAAASIIAKVKRDRLMASYQALFPQFDFAKHKGYGTPLHKESIRQHRWSLTHRKTFLRSTLVADEYDEKQQTIF